MFTKRITESDAFLEMPSSSQMLYFHLSMNADDDGFVSNPRKIQRMCGASNDDYSLLIMKRFILTFDSGVIVIKHWRMHNYIQSDRYKPTDYIDEKSMLGLKKNKSYTLDESQMDSRCIQAINDNDSGSSIEDKKKQEEIESIKEIVAYLNMRTGTRYRYQAQSTQKHIRARLNEHFTVDDFKAVIDKKYAEWNGTKMSKFLRPETLFGTKFESYLNQSTSTVNSANGKISEWSELRT